MQRLIALLIAGAVSSPALAHPVSEHTGDWVLWMLGIALVAYVIGWIRSRHRPAIWRPVLMLGGWLLLAVALVGPIESWQDASLAGHMVQHMLLLAVVPPMLLLARPMPQYMQALPLRLRRRIGPLLGRIYAGAGRTPLAAFIVHGAVIWLWHLPEPYQLALVYKLVHDAEHLLFFTTGLWFWWSLIAPGRLGQPGFGLAALLAVLTMMHTGMLGALMTFAPQLLYPQHPAGFAGFDQLSDQQLAGLLMWVPGGLIYSAAALALTGLWLQRMNQLESNSNPAGELCGPIRKHRSEGVSL